MAAVLKAIKAYPLVARFADIYGGDDQVPPEVRRPSSHFQSIPRLGQYCTIVVCEGSDGTVGFGECFGLPTPYAAAEIVNRVAADALTGLPLSSPSSMASELRRFFLALGHSKGPAMEALAGIDIALWDLFAKREGKSLATFLGAQPRDVPTYISPVPLLPSPTATAAAAADLSIGFDAVKLKVGRSARADIPHIAAAREAVGPDTALMLDANCGYTLEEATILVREIGGLDIRWLEEPLAPDDYAGLRALADVSPVSLAGGENEFTPEAFARLMSETGLQVVQPNITRAGGVSGLMEIDRLAGERGVAVSPHGVGGSIAVAATLHAASAMQHFDVFEINRLPNPLRDELGHASPVGPSGLARPPAGPGHGSDVSDGMNRYREAAIRAAE